ncbi:MAG: tetratricopeptide repeat protein [Candidatus Latescibacterota bacterium]
MRPTPPADNSRRQRPEGSQHAAVIHRLGLLPILLLAAACQAPALNAAKVYLGEGEPGRARTQLERAVQEHPHSAEAYLLLGQVAAQQADFVLMDSSLRMALSLDPRQGEVIAALRHEHWARQHNTGVGLARSHPPQYPAALRAFANAVLADPAPLEAWRGLAYVYVRLNSLDRAVQVYEHVLGSVPEDTTCLAAVGGLYLQQERHAEAAGALSRLALLTPRDVATHINLGIALENLRQTPAARLEYERALALDAGSALAHYNLGNLCWHAGEFPAARTHYEQALALAPQDKDIRYNLAVTCVRLQDLARAVDLLEGLAQAHPEDASVWRELGRLYARLGRPSESHAALDRAGSLSPP